MADMIERLTAKSPDNLEELREVAFDVEEEDERNVEKDKEMIVMTVKWPVRVRKKTLIAVRVIQRMKRD